MADTVPTWLAMAGVVGTGLLTFAGTIYTRTTRTPAETDKKDTDMLSAALKENRELRGEFEKIWGELADCQKHHRECLQLHQEAADRSARLERELSAVAGKVSTLQQQQHSA